MRSFLDYRSVWETAGAADPEPDQLLGALALLGSLRHDLDRHERSLIESARERGISWAQLSTALGLGSRQAAEQRWLRLGDDPARDPRSVRAARRRQQNVDARYGEPIGKLRSAAAAAHRLIEGDPAWDGRHPRAALARTSLGVAVTAEPGALYALVVNAVEDLAALPGPGLPAALGRAIHRLRRSLDAATPP